MFGVWIDRGVINSAKDRSTSDPSQDGVLCQADPKTEHPMRRSRFMQNEILQLLGEASAGVPVADICEAAGVTPRTFYRWRRQFGGLDVPAVRQMKELVSENLRLRGLVSNLFEQLRTSADGAPGERSTLKTTAPRTEERARDQKRASRIAAEKCGGALTGHFASVRVNR
jgi:putative transposase